MLRGRLGMLWVLWEIAVHPRLTHTPGRTPGPDLAKAADAAWASKKPLSISGLRLVAALDSHGEKGTGGADGTRTRDPRRDRPVF